MGDGIAMWRRVGWRVVACYLALYALCCANATAWEGVPFAGYWLEGAAAWPFHHAARWVAVHCLQLTGLAAELHGSGYNDRALDYIGASLMFCCAVVIAAVWTALRRQANAEREYLWLRWLLRMTMAVSMLVYGLWKLAPLQIHTPLLAVLNEPVGQTSPMALFWATIGTSAWYTRVTGFAELACAALLFYRRTALAGTLLTVVVMSNVLLFDVFFDVPVKLYSANLLLMCAVAMGPDLKAMVEFFWRHEAAVSSPGAAWAPKLASRRAAMLLVAAEVVMGLTVLQLKGESNWKYYARARELREHPSPLLGEWHVEAGGLKVVDGEALVDVFFEPDGFVVERGANGRLWSAGMYGRDTSAVTLAGTGYGVKMAGDELELMSGGTVVRLKRVSLPERYPLLEYQRHWVNEYPVER